MDRYSVVSGIFTAGAICTCTGTAGALAPGALSAALFWQPDTNSPAARARSKGASSRPEAGTVVLLWIEAIGRIPVYLASNLTTLLSWSKMERVRHYFGRRGNLLVIWKFLAAG